MEENKIKASEASYFKSAAHVMNGQLILTNQRITYSGTQVRTKMNHGALGNVLRDKLEDKMGYSNPQEELIMDIPLNEITHSIKRFGLSKRLVITDKSGNEFKFIIKKSERLEWPEAIDKAKNNL